MSASAEMPYFIKPSLPLSQEEKEQRYQEATAAIDANLAGEHHFVLKMSTICCLMKTFLPYYYWVGFYCLVDGKLSVGPYQGTLGCLHIELGKGVCGKAALEQKTQIVSNVHALSQGSEHIACDPNSASEIVVPVFNESGALIAVFDVDSTVEGSFDETDRYFLEKMMDKHFRQGKLIMAY